MNILIDEKKFEFIHEYSLKILEQTGMKFLSEEILGSLERNGATIDWSKNIACIPKNLVQKKLEEQIKQLKTGKKQLILNGAVSSRTENKISCKFGSGAFYIFDWERQEKRRAKDKDVENYVILGHALSLLSTLHDIGKIALSEEILTSKRKLTDKEWAIIKKHPEIGYNICTSSPQIVHIAEGVLGHHEWYNGAGYPHSLKGENIPITSRIISIVDAYDVMISGRIYKKAITKKEAIKELKRCSGTQFDPKLVDVFINIVLKGNLELQLTGAVA
jgi:hypothetical protein